MKLLQCSLFLAVGAATCMAAAIISPQIPLTDLTQARALKLADADIFNFAVFLENLELAYYKEGLQKNFTVQDFVKAGHEAAIYNRFLQVLENEQAHVDFLTNLVKTLGKTPLQPCTYDFPVTTVDDFIEFSKVLETVGTSAYSFASGVFTDGTDSVIAASLYGVEARQAAWVGGAVQRQNSWNSPYDIPLSPRKVLTLATPAVKSCPTSNAALPVKPFPQLDITLAATGGALANSGSITFHPPAGQSQGLWAAFISGTNVEFSKLDGAANTVSIPTDVNGIVYVLLTNKQDISDGSVVAGPRILDLPFDSQNKRLGVKLF